MNLEIHKPELVQRVNAHIQTGYHCAFGSTVITARRLMKVVVGI
jgi:hypothetical protein